MEVGDNALIVTALFDVFEIPYAELNALLLANYVITVKADSGDYAFSKMGSWCQPFYDKLYEAYNKAVLRSLFVKGSPIVRTNGEVRFTESGAKSSNAAPVHVYGNSVVSLPPNLEARRVPLCFLTGMEKGSYELTLKVDADETYTYSKMGYDFEPVADAVEKDLREIRDRSLADVKEICPSLTSMQASQIAKIMPKGAAASFGQITAIAPPFAAAMEERISKTRAAETYKAFKEMCNPSQIYVGFKKKEGSAENTTEASEGEETEAQKPNDFLLWLIAPSQDGRFVAVEFAVTDAATFVYRTGGDFNRFARQLNRALEAIDFKREVIWMSDADLRKPENVDYFMAAKRTAALRYVRSSFVGRVIHLGAEAWKNNLKELWSGK